MGCLCPVCGYSDLEESAYRTDGWGSEEICPSCSFQFGVSDKDRHYSHEQWRSKWIENGMIWDKGTSQPPEGWDPKKQLENLTRISGAQAG